MAGRLWDPEIRHTPDFLILLSGGGIPGKTARPRERKTKISSPGGRAVSSRGKPCAASPIICPSLSGGTRCQKEAKR
jgi:hypothetical protein